MRPNMDAEIVVLQSVLANAKDEHQLKAGLAHAIELLEENVSYAGRLETALFNIIASEQHGWPAKYQTRPEYIRAQAEAALAKNQRQGADSPASATTDPSGEQDQARDAVTTAAQPLNAPLATPGAQSAPATNREALTVKIAEAFAALHDAVGGFTMAVNDRPNNRYSPEWYALNRVFDDTIELQEEVEAMLTEAKWGPVRQAMQEYREKKAAALANKGPCEERNDTERMRDGWTAAEQGLNHAEHLLRRVDEAAKAIPENVEGCLEPLSEVIADVRDFLKTGRVTSTEKR